VRRDGDARFLPSGDAGRPDVHRYSHAGGADGRGFAWCEGRGDRQRLDTLLVGPRPAGSWVLAFRGSALRIMSPEDAVQTNAALDALEVALVGGRTSVPSFRISSGASRNCLNT